ncbi:MAG: patatin-like phospholipase family protein, partial [Candidatus Eremiobacterota bacterium]
GLMGLLLPSSGPGLPHARQALVLEGGGARGAFEAGALLYLHEHPEVFRADAIAGTSVGALNGAAYAFGRTPELAEVWCRLKNRDVYRNRSFFWMAVNLLARHTWTHIYDTTPLYGLLTAVFGDLRMLDCPLQLRIAAFNLQSGQAEIFSNESPVKVVDALMASSALQGLFPPHTLNGFQYIDGGNGANLPLRPALQTGATDVVLIRSAGRQRFVPRAYQDVVRIQMRAHLALLAQVTSSDLSRAEELTRLLAQVRRERACFQELVESVVSQPEERARLLEGLRTRCGADNGKRTVRLRVIAPPPGALLPSVLEFDPTVSFGLFRMGYHQAQRVLGEVPRV